MFKVDSVTFSGRFKNNNRGKAGEDNIESALDALKAERIITNYIRNKQNSPDDKAGIDFWVFRSGQMMPLQVKSSRSGLKKHYKRHGDIPAIIGHGKDLLERLYTTVFQYFNGKRKWSMREAG